MPIILREFARASGGRSAQELWAASEEAYAKLADDAQQELRAWLEWRWLDAGSKVVTLHAGDCLAHAGTIAQADDLEDRPAWFWKTLAGCREFMDGLAEKEAPGARCVLVARPRRTLRLAALSPGLSDMPAAVSKMTLETRERITLHAAQSWCSSCGMDGLGSPASGSLLISTPASALNAAGFLLEDELARTVDEAGA